MHPFPCVYTAFACRVVVWCYYIVYCADVGVRVGCVVICSCCTRVVVGCTCFSVCVITVVAVVRVVVVVLLLYMMCFVCVFFVVVVFICGAAAVVSCCVLCWSLSLPMVLVLPLRVLVYGLGDGVAIATSYPCC